MAYNWAPFQDIRLWNDSDLDFHLTRSLKVKYDGAIGLPIYGFLLFKVTYMYGLVGFLHKI